MTKSQETGPVPNSNDDYSTLSLEELIATHDTILVLQDIAIEAKQAGALINLQYKLIRVQNALHQKDPSQHN